MCANIFNKDEDLAISSEKELFFDITEFLFKSVLVILLGDASMSL